MKTIEDDIDDLAGAARRDTARAFAQGAAQIPGIHQPYVAAHLAFALLHMALVTAQAALVKNGFPAELSVYGSEITLRVASRQIVCRFFLHETKIESLFMIEGGSIDRRMWPPPTVMDPAVLYEWARGVVHAMATFVTGRDR